MYGVGEAITGLFYAFVFAVSAALILVVYVFWQAFFGFTPWEVCVRMETDQAKVQCMEAHYE
jgi:type IV secretory pathway TrbD component